MASIAESISNLSGDKCDFIVFTKLHFRIMLSEHVQEQAFFSACFGCKRSLLCKWLSPKHIATNSCSHTLPGHFTQYPIWHQQLGSPGSTASKPLSFPIPTPHLSPLHPHSYMYWLAAMSPQWLYVYAVWWKAFFIDAATFVMNMHLLLIFPIETQTMLGLKTCCHPSV